MNVNHCGMSLRLYFASHNIDRRQGCIAVCFVRSTGYMKLSAAKIRNTCERQPFLYLQIEINGKTYSAYTYTYT